MHSACAIAINAHSDCHIRFLISIAPKTNPSIFEQSANRPCRNAPRRDRRIGDSVNVRNVDPGPRTASELLRQIPRQSLLSRGQPTEDSGVRFKAISDEQSGDFTRGNVLPSWEQSPQQIAARQVIAKELPTFTAHTEDWPLFVSSFTNTTQACGYSEEENLARLQRCLKGNAIKAVQSQLLFTDSRRYTRDRSCYKTRLCRSSVELQLRSKTGSTR